MNSFNSYLRSVIFVTQALIAVGIPTSSPTDSDGIQRKTSQKIACALVGNEMICDAAIVPPKSASLLQLSKFKEFQADGISQPALTAPLKNQGTGEVIISQK